MLYGGLRVGGSMLAYMHTCMHMLLGQLSCTLAPGSVLRCNESKHLAFLQI